MAARSTFIAASAAASAAAAAAVRVRYAPSPTGSLHLGGLRTALFNYLFAAANGGAFLLRIEDTDRERYVPGSIAGIIRSLSWCGLPHSEGPTLPAGNAGSEPTMAADFPSLGPHGPYIQSLRLPRYRMHADAMLASGHAYRCFCSTERLAAVRAAQLKAGRPVMYDRTCAKLPQQEAERRAAAGEPHVVRLRVPDGDGATAIADAVLGPVRFAHAVVDDQVLLKSDGFPTYHLASVVDDHEMAISHVIRGQEWLSSTPKHMLTYAALGWTPPTFAHLPLLLNTDRSKLSKRHGDVAVEDYRARGYLPEALVNFVALLGWTPPAGSETLTLNDMIPHFRTLGNINKANAIADRARLDYVNGMHMRRMILTCLPASSAPAAGGKAAPASPWELPRRRDGELPLSLPDTPAAAQLRGLVQPLVIAAAADLVTADGAGTAADTLSPSVGRWNALLVAQVERARVASDFVPLLLPFIVTGPRYAAYWRRQCSDGNIVARLTKAASKAKVATGAAAVDGKESATVSAPAATPAPSIASLLDGPTTTALRRVMLTWAAETADWDVEAPPLATGFPPLAALRTAASEAVLPPQRLMLASRFILTGLDVGPSVTDVLRLLGRAEAVRRFELALGGDASTVSVAR